MNDFKAEPAELQTEMLAAVQRVIASGWYVLGPEVQAFEQRWAEDCQLPRAIGVGNGMDAIELILRGLNIGPGDEVITTPMTAFASVLAILRAGAVPVLADIDPDTALLSRASVERCLTPRTRAVLLVHLYGQVRDMAEWQILARDKGFALVEDCAQSHRATLGGVRAGGFGVAGAYSFYPTKNLGALGDGGAVVTRDMALADRVARLRNYGQSERYHHPEIGMNSRLDEMQAAILSVRLNWLAGYTERRQQIAQRYRAELKQPAIRLLAAPQETAAHAYHLFVVCSAHRDALVAHLKAAGVQALLHYPVPMHHQQTCLDMRRDPLGLPASEQHALQCLSLPCHPQLDDAQLDQVIAAVNSFRAI
ncbi:DegT/DnrJ/EryC1/StrS family aminotransferase [Ideonella margarita]|uniref:DegT/DnrJ/EryC1/StrS family aminotransferase n=1 Tax=Ideonella margarita TaxID=2984191 RepID=A0ABU9C268_9BURK